MRYTIEIRKLGESGALVGDLHRFDTETATAAIDLARLKLKSAPRESHPLNVAVFDDTRRLILSYTSTNGIRSNFIEEKLSYDSASIRARH